MIFRIFSATDRKAGTYFRIDSNKILNGLRGKSHSGLNSVVQSFTPNGSENPCVAGSIPVLANLIGLKESRAGFRLETKRSAMQGASRRTCSGFQFWPILWAERKPSRLSPGNETKRHAGRESADLFRIPVLAIL